MSSWVYYGNKPFSSKRARVCFGLSLLVYLPNSDNAEASKFPFAQDSRSWQYSLSLNKSGLRDWTIKLIMETEIVISTADNIPTKILPGWRRTLKRAKPKRTRPLPPTIMKRHIAKYAMVNTVMAEKPAEGIEPTIWFDRFEVSYELSFSVNGVTFIFDTEENLYNKIEDNCSR